MADSALAKNFEFNFDITDQWLTYDSSRDKTNIVQNCWVKGSKNVYKKLSGNIANRQGQKRLGAADPTESGCPSEYVWNTSWGATYVLVVSNGKLNVIINNVWYVLLSGLTATRYVFDKWWDNTEKKDRVLFVHGNSDEQHWAGGYSTVNAQVAGGATLTKTGSTTFQQAGFSTTSGQMQFTINGSATVYTYTGGTGTTTLTGITPALPVITQDTVVLSAVQTTANTPAAGFNNDFIKVINNQVYVGSYTSRLCYISSNTDFTNYVVPTPRLPGSPEFLTLDATLNGISVRQGNAYISFGTDSWAAIIFTDITVGTTLTQQTKIDIKPVAVNQAAYAHEFIDSTGDNIIYLAKDQQVRVVGDFNNGFTPRYPSLSQEIATELSLENFNGGGLRCIGEFIYITAPTRGNLYLRQERERVDENSQVVSEKLWHAPWVSNATRIDSINGVVVSFSNANPQIYQIWDTNQWHDDSPSDEPLPYESILALAYRGGKRRQGLWSFDKYFTEGYITPGTSLNVLMNYNYQGALNSVIAIINSIAQPAYLFSPNGGSNPSLGDDSLGDSILGDDIVSVTDDQEALPKFKNINSLGQINCFEYQPIIYSDTADARWEILAEGTNAKIVPEENANYLINKVRTS